MEFINFYLRLILAGLTCYRLAQFISMDWGPWNIFLRFRAYIEQVAQKRQGHFWKSLPELAACPYCQGLYLGIPCAALVLWPTFYGDLILLWLGIVGFQAFLQSVGSRE